MKLLAVLLLLTPWATHAQISLEGKPLRIGIAGLTHGHVHWILRSVKEGTVELAGIAEPNRDLAERLMRQYGIDSTLWYADLDKMLLQTKPEAVTAFGSIFEHLEVVKACAPRKIHVMVEKPLAVSLEHAREMETLARRNGIHLLTNYETTWYGSNHRAFSMIHEEKLFGEIRKIVVHDGHQGPKEIGVNSEFLQWLTDPKLNGAGALMDFGCYGADLMTWLMKGQRPLSVSAVTQQLKPEIYPEVDDEATIIVTYPKAQGIIQASWNWPYNRKDMEVYGKTGYIFADRTGINFLVAATKKAVSEEVPERGRPFNDPFLFLEAVVRGKIKLEANDLSSLSVNMVAMEILDAAKRSATSGKVIRLEHK